MKILSIVIKDIQILFKERGTLFQLFILPLLFIFVFSGALTSIGSAPKDTRILLVVVDQDGGQAAQTLLSELDAAGGVRTELYDQQQAQTALDERKVDRLLFIPAGFSTGVAEATPVVLRLVSHPDASPQQTEAVRLVVEGVAANMALESQIVASLEQMGAMQANASEQNQVFTTQRVVAQARSQFERSQTQPLIAVVQMVPAKQGEIEITPELAQTAVPGFTVLFVFLAAQNTARSIHEEKRIGSFRRLMAAPLSKMTLLLGKIMPNFLTSLVQTIVILIFGSLGLRMMGLPSLPIENAPLGVALVAILLALCSSALGILIAALVRSEKQVGGMSTLLLWGMALLGGSIAPLFILERFLGSIPMIVPHYWANRAMDNLLVRGLPLSGILLELAMLLGFSILFFVIGLWRFDFE
jgi:ABC-2 type transport system permease protein